MSLVGDAIDMISIAAYSVIGIAILVFAILGAKQWRIERETKRADAHSKRARALTWNLRTGEWVAEPDGVVITLAQQRTASATDKSSGRGR
jgi:hypothetical protein